MAQESTCVVASLDHLVLTVASIDATVAFYTRHLGMRHQAFASPKDPSVQRHALLFGKQKINLHQHGAEFEPKAERVTPGSGDVCFVSETPVDEVLASLKRQGIPVLEDGQVVERSGARGQLRSVYIRDPDGNLVE